MQGTAGCSACGARTAQLRMLQCYGWPSASDQTNLFERRLYEWQTRTLLRRTWVVELRQPLLQHVAQLAVQLTEVGLKQRLVKHLQ